MDVQQELGDKSARELSEQTGVDVRFYKVDVRDGGAIQQAVQDIKEHYGQIDVLINAAGIADSNIKAETYDAGGIADSNIKAENYDTEKFCHLLGSIHPAVQDISYEEGEGKLLVIAAGIADSKIKAVVRRRHMVDK